MIRVLQQGVGPTMVHYAPDMTAGVALQHAQRSLGPNQALAVNGHRASLDHAVRAGDTVTVQPMAVNG